MILTTDKIGNKKVKKLEKRCWRFFESMLLSISARMRADKIIEVIDVERCPSGLRSWSWKPVTPQGAVGSNPTFSVSLTKPPRWFCLSIGQYSSMLGEVPKWPKGFPWKGNRSLIAARGFKSLLLRQFMISTLKYFKKYIDRWLNIWYHGFRCQQNSELILEN